METYFLHSQKNLFLFDFMNEMFILYLYTVNRVLGAGGDHGDDAYKDCSWGLRGNPSE